jgi:hypothetical protein
MKSSRSGGNVLNNLAPSLRLSPEDSSSTSSSGDSVRAKSPAGRPPQSLEALRPTPFPRTQMSRSQQVLCGKMKTQLETISALCRTK